MDLSPQDYEDLYYYLLLTRRAEEKMRDEKKVIPGNLYLSTYQEAVSVGAAFAALGTDWISHTHRDLGALLTRNRWDLKDVFANILGKADGPARGRDSGLNFGSIAKRTIPKHIFMSINLPIACGAAGQEAVLAFLGDGATSQGYFHVAMNEAGLEKLPIIFIVNNNQYAISTPVEKQVAGGSIVRRAGGYGFPGIFVDGTDILAVYEATKVSLARARSGEGPTLIEAKTFRLSGHAERDDPLAYIPPERWAQEKTSQKDPLARYRQHLLDNVIMNEDDFAAQEEDAKSEIEEAWAQALAMPLPEPGSDQIFAEDAR